MKKHRATGVELVIDVDDPDNDDIDPPGAGSELTTGEKFCKPLYLLYTWKEPATMTKRITAAVLLSSGVDSGAFSISISPGDMSLEITVEWPAPMVDLTMMHKKCLRPDAPGVFQVFRPKYTAFEDALKKIRDRISDQLVSVARIPLPYAVETHIDSKYNLAWRESSAKIVYVEMTAFVEQYAVVKDQEEFEIL